MEITVTFTLPELLANELKAACRECEMPINQFAAESVESVLASRRLPGIQVGRCGARVGKEVL